LPGQLDAVSEGRRLGAALERDRRRLVGPPPRDDHEHRGSLTELAGDRALAERQRRQELRGRTAAGHAGLDLVAVGVEVLLRAVDAVEDVRPRLDDDWAAVLGPSVAGDPAVLASEPRRALARAGMHVDAG